MTSTSRSKPTYQPAISSSKCDSSLYGCCPDGSTAALGPNHGGCPSICQCNKLGKLTLLNHSMKKFLNMLTIKSQVQSEKFATQRLWNANVDRVSVDPSVIVVIPDTGVYPASLSKVIRVAWVSLQV